jgi:catechol 2,3-dioxygenase-like lactoylglutathione lyase family enzyme
VRLTVTSDDAAHRFYEIVLATIGGPAEDFELVDGDKPTRGLHIGFSAPSFDAIQRFWRAGVDAGYRDDGQPGLRAIYGFDYYGGFLLDPDGNSAEACLHDNSRRAGLIDHVWMRVADVEASREFYEGTVGLTLANAEDGLARFARDGGIGFTVVGAGHGTHSLGGERDVPSENVGLAFAGAEPATDPDGNRVGPA